MCIDANTVLKYNHIDCGTLELLFIKTQKVIFTLLLQIYNYEHFLFTNIHIICMVSLLYEKS